MRRILVFLVVILLCGCQSAYEVKIKDSIEEMLRNISGYYEKVYIIPGMGCSGCITNAENFYKLNHNDSKALFIFTSIKSIKVLRKKFSSIDFENSGNVIIDTDCVFYSYSDEESFYPHVIDLNGLKVKRIRRF